MNAEMDGVVLGKVSKGKLRIGRLNWGVMYCILCNTPSKV